jgi:hypothetical protein
MFIPSDPTIISPPSHDMGLDLIFIGDSSLAHYLEPRKGGGGGGRGGGGGGSGHSMSSTILSLPVLHFSFPFLVGGSSGKGSGGSNSGSKSGSKGGSSGSSKVPVSDSKNLPNGKKVATSYGSGGGKPITIPRGQLFAGRTAGGGTRSEVYGNRYGDIIP